MLDIIPLIYQACVRKYHYSRISTLATGVVKNHWVIATMWLSSYGVHCAGGTVLWWIRQVRPETFLRALVV